MQARMHWNAILFGLAIMSAAANAQAQQQLLYRYDPQGRLVRVARPLSGMQGYITTYAYDDADNRTERNTAFGPTANLMPSLPGVPEIRLADIDNPPMQPAAPSKDVGFLDLTFADTGRPPPTP